jgi:hypothetical protein
MKYSAVSEKPLKTASGGVGGVLVDVMVLHTDKAAPAPSRGVRIFFMVSPLDGLENKKKRPANGAVFGGDWQSITVSYRYLEIKKKKRQTNAGQAGKQISQYCVTFLNSLRLLEAWQVIVFAPFNPHHSLNSGGCDQPQWQH